MSNALSGRVRVPTLLVFAVPGFVPVTSKSRPASENTNSRGFSWKDAVAVVVAVEDGFSRLVRTGHLRPGTGE